MPSDEQDKLTVDTAFMLLSNERRRHMLCLLAERDEKVQLETVAAEIAAGINGIDPEEVDDSTLQSVYVALYQSHVPQLAGANVVHHDEDERAVRIAHTPETKQLLRFAGVECGPSWHREYALVFGAATLAAVASISGVVELLPESWMLPGIVLLGGVASLSAYQYHARHRVSVSDCGGLIDEADSRY